MYKNLKHEMKENGVTNRELAAAIKVSEKTARNYVNGNTDVPLRNAFLISDFFGKPIEYLFAE